MINPKPLETKKIEYLCFFRHEASTYNLKPEIKNYGYFLHFTTKKQELESYPHQLKLDYKNLYSKSLNNKSQNKSGLL